MKKIKRLISTLIAITMAITPVCAMAYDKPLDVRAIQSDSYFTPYYEANNPFVTHYAPWLRNFHLMRSDEAAANLEAGIAGGESNQQVRMLEVSTVDPKHMYFITNTSGIYKTTNGGKHWYNTTNNMRGNEARGLWCDVLDENIVYASLCRDGFYRSKDGGKSWELILEDLDNKSAHRSNTITQDSLGNTYFAASSGIYRLNRDDDTLECLYDAQQLIPSGNGSISSKPDIGPLWWDIDVSSKGGHIYAAVGTHSDSKCKSPGLYMSKDSGKTWTKSSSSAISNVYSVTLHPKYSSSNPKIYVAAKSASLGYCRLYLSENGGSSFEQKLLSAAGLETQDFYGLRFGPDNGSGVYLLYFSANGTDHPLYVSDDYGQTALVVYSYEDDIDGGTLRGDEDYTGFRYQAFAPDMTKPNRLIFAACGIYEKTNGKFKRISGGFSGTSVTSVAFNSKNRPFLAVTDRGSYYADGSYKNDGNTITYPTFKQGTNDKFTMAEFNPANDAHIVATVGISNGNDGYFTVRQSKNTGKSFSGAVASLSILDKTALKNDTVIQFDGDNIYTSYFTSRDGGDTWSRNKHQNGTKMFIYAISKTNPNLMIGTTSRLENDDGSENKTTVLQKSTDGGVNWTNTGVTLGINPDFDSAEFDVYGKNGEDNGDWVWMVRKARVYHVNINTGEQILLTSSANKPATGIIPDRFKKIAQNPNNPNHILLGSQPNQTSVGTDNKISESYDGGLTWHTVPGLWGAAINDIKFVPGSTEVFICTMGGIMIYDYEKYNYYSSVLLTAENQSSVWANFERVNDSREKVNNGKYIIAPENPFEFSGEIFKSWKYNGKSYSPGELIPLD